MGVPEGAVRVKLAQEGLDPNILFSSEHGGNSTQPMENPAHSQNDINESRASEQNAYICLGYVRYSFSASSENDDEISLKEGDYIEISATHEDDWWEGTIRGTANTGVFPMNHVSLVLEFKGQKYLMDTETKEVLEMSNQEKIVGIYDEKEKQIIDRDGTLVADWSEAVLL